MTSVLYDVPGPKARRRNMLFGIAGVIVVGAILGFIIYRLWYTGQFSERLWSVFTYPLVQQQLLQAISNTLRAFAVASVLSLALGLLLAIGRLSDKRWISRPIGWITELFRAIPVLLLMALVYYGLPPAGVQGITPYVAVVSALVIYNGSVLAEVFRAGIAAIPRGQSEAGSAVGMTKMQITFQITLPQAVRLMLPVIVAQLVVVMKDTALGFIITYNEVIYFAGQIGSQFDFGYPIIPAGLVAAAVYIGMCLLLSGVAKLLEKRMNRIPKTKIEV